MSGDRTSRAYQLLYLINEVDISDVGETVRFQDEDWHFDRDGQGGLMFESSDRTYRFSVSVFMDLKPTASLLMGLSNKPT